MVETRITLKQRDARIAAKQAMRSTLKVMAAELQREIKEKVNVPVTVVRRSPGSLKKAKGGSSESRSIASAVEATNELRAQKRLLARLTKSLGSARGLNKKVIERRIGIRLKRISALEESAITSGAGSRGGVIKIRSKPGEYPRKDTGQFRNGVRVKAFGDHADIVTKKTYGVYLDEGTPKMAARPWAARTINDRAGFWNDKVRAWMRQFFRQHLRALPLVTKRR